MHYLPLDELRAMASKGDELAISALIKRLRKHQRSFLRRPNRKPYGSIQYIKPTSSDAFYRCCKAF